MVVGFLLPDFYHKYLDFNEYLVIRYPISVDKTEYKPCEYQTLFSTYTAQFNVNVESHNELNRLNEDGSFTKVYSEIKYKNFDKAVGRPYSVQLQIPCDLEDGTYFWSGIKEYKINSHIKGYSFTTDSFDVRKE